MLSNEVLNAIFPPGASKLPELKNLYFRIYLIKADFFGSFNFDFWQFWCPLRKSCVQYLIWKLSIVVLNLLVGMGLTAHLQITTLFQKLPILLHKQTKWRFIMKVAVPTQKSDIICGWPLVLTYVFLIF